MCPRKSPGAFATLVQQGDIAGRAGRGAGAAACTDGRIDCHRVAVRRDGACRTKVKTPRAASDSRPRVGTERFVELDKAWLVERADQMSCLRDYFFDRGAVAGIGAEIARSQFMGGK